MEGHQLMLEWKTLKGVLFIIIIIIIIISNIIIVTPEEFFTSALADGLSQEFEW